MSETRTARPIRELRIPIRVRAFLETADPSGYSPPEYFVVEEWSDGTIRNPATGMCVVMRLWDTHREKAIHILRAAPR